MIRRILSLFGYQITYICEWGEYEFRYDAIDRMATRPIHKDMGVAPPWARLKISRINR